MDDSDILLPKIPDVYYQDFLDFLNQFDCLSCSWSRSRPREALSKKKAAMLSFKKKLLLYSFSSLSITL